jgi:hypothetical protein
VIARIGGTSGDEIVVRVNRERRSVSPKSVKTSLCLVKANIPRGTVTLLKDPRAAPKATGQE